MKWISFLIVLVGTSTAMAATPSAWCTAEDQGVIFQAKWDIGAGDWAGALDKISSLPQACQATRGVQLLGAYSEVGVCGFSPQRFVASKVMLSYPLLMNPEFKFGPVKPEACALAVKRLESIGRRTVEESMLLGAASVGWLSTTLMQRFDKDGDGQVDVELDVCNEEHVSMQTLSAVFAAQGAFVRHATKVSGRPDLGALAGTIQHRCSASRVCGTAIGDLSAAEVKVARSLLRTFLQLPVVGNCVR